MGHSGHRAANRASHPEGGAGIPDRRERRFVFYSHDGLGLGHIRRNLALAAALAEADPEAAILLATSAQEVEELGIPERTDVLRLPGLQKVANGVYAPRRLRLPPGDVGDVRATLIEGAVAAFRPAMLIVDKHPLGIAGELRPALAALKGLGGRAVLGLRDILDDPESVRREWSADGVVEDILEWYDRVLVYGTSGVFDAVRHYGFPPELRELARYCGYVVSPPERRLEERPPRTSGRPVVLGMAGGGEDGYRLLEAFLEASSRAAWEAIVVSGRQAGRAEREALREQAARVGATFHTFVPRLASLFPRLDAVVCMGGYNTLVEAAAAGVPTVCVPRMHPRQEQLVRARLFARLRLLRLIEPGDLEPARLRAEVSTALEWRREGIAGRARACLGLGGAQVAANELLELAAAAPTPYETVGTVS